MHTHTHSLTHTDTHARTHTEFFDAKIDTDGAVKIVFDERNDDYTKPPDNYVDVIEAARSSFLPPQKHIAIPYQRAIDDSTPAKEGEYVLTQIYSNFKINTSRGICTYEDEEERMLFLQGLRTLQYCEELQMDSDIKGYDMHWVKVLFTLKDTILGTSGENLQYYKLSAKIKVKGASENRPSVMLGRFMPFFLSFFLFFSLSVFSFYFSFLVSLTHSRIHS
jgi:hypothetical protein